MGKMKVHELAKELNLPSKDLVERLNNMGYSIKSHLSTLEDSEVAEIRKKFDNKNKEDGKKNQVKKDKKPIAPVIIRREVTRVESTEDKKEMNHRNDRSDLGVVQRRTDTTMNIKYRTEPRKISPIVTNRKEENKNVELKNESLVSKDANNIKKEQELETKDSLEKRNSVEKVIETKDEMLNTLNWIVSVNT